MIKVCADAANGRIHRSSHRDPELRRIVFVYTTPQMRILLRSHDFQLPFGTVIGSRASVIVHRSDVRSAIDPPCVPRCWVGVGSRVWIVAWAWRLVGCLQRICRNALISNANKVVGNCTIMFTMTSFWNYIIDASLSTRTLRSSEKLAGCRQLTYPRGREVGNFHGQATAPSFLCGRLLNGLFVMGFRQKRAEMFVKYLQVSELLWRRQNDETLVCAVFTLSPLTGFRNCLHNKSVCTMDCLRLKMR